MKKVARILYLVGGIYSFVCTGTAVVIGFVFALLGALRVFREDPTTTAARAEAANLTFLILGIVFLVYAIPMLLAGLFALRSRNVLASNKHDKGLYITTMVFGIITFEPFVIVPAIFSMRISNWKTPEKEEVNGEVAD